MYPPPFRGITPRSGSATSATAAWRACERSVYLHACLYAFFECVLKCAIVRSVYVCLRVCSRVYVCAYVCLCVHVSFSLPPRFLYLLLFKYIFLCAGIRTHRRDETLVEGRIRYHDKGWRRLTPSLRSLEER